MKSPANVPCTVCGSTRSALLFATEYSELGYPGRFEMRYCRCCALLFNSPRLDPESLSALYGAGYYVFARSPGEERERVLDVLARTFGRFPDDFDLGSRVLEVGCARGFLLAVLRNRGFSVSGIELSESAARFARERFGLPVATGTIESVASSPAAPRPVDALLGIDVLEHVPDPPGFLRAAARLVRPGGRIVIDTPNGAAPNIGLLGTSWIGFNPFHIYLFTPRNLVVLLEASGFAVDRLMSYGHTPADVAPGRVGISERLRARAGLRGLFPAAGRTWLRRARAWLADRCVAGLDTERFAADVSALAASEASGEVSLPGSRKGRADSLTTGLEGDNLLVFARRRSEPVSA